MIFLLSLLLLVSVSAVADDSKTRGIGVYPGRPTECFAPMLVADNSYRNLALNRMAFSSSSFDHNLTAQLATDGIIGTGELPRLEVLANGRLLSKREREWSIDTNPYSFNTLMGATADLEYRWSAMSVDVDSVAFNVVVAYNAAEATRGFDFFLREADSQFFRQSQNGLPGEDMHYTLHSDPNKQTERPTLPGRRFTIGAKRNNQAPLTALTLHMNMPGAQYWQVSELKFFRKGRPVNTNITPATFFESAWMSATDGEREEEWLSVDLGDVCKIYKVRIYWGSDSRGTLQASDDNENWRTLTEIAGRKGEMEEHVAVNNARYIRLSLDSRINIVRELEVYGTGGLKAVASAAPEIQDRTLSLNGGEWRLHRATEKIDGAKASMYNYDTSDWIVATVPGTVLTSYVNVGAVPDPNYDDNIALASDSYFNSNFFYRRVFEFPTHLLAHRIYLNLDGINWKAQIWLNGKKVGRVEGAFQRGKIDISRYMFIGKNCLLIEIERPDHPGNTKEKNEKSTDINGGLIGADNPTFHATVGWDWITSVRGRDIGIWNDISVTAERESTLLDPIVTTTLNLPDTLASVTMGVSVRNNLSQPVKGVLKGWLGSITFEKEFTIEKGTKLITFTPEEFPQLKDQPLALWWPNGYGEAVLHDAGFEITLPGDGGDVDRMTFKAGLRQVTWEDEDTQLKLYVNGRRFIPLGGNWGFSEHNLNYRAREFDAAVRFHREMNFNTIRNWVGQTGQREFYDACDRYGIMVWQDFWLANPADGPDPYSNQLFYRNAEDYTRRIRLHPSLLLYCGRNEGVPPANLDRMLRSVVGNNHPGMLYISDSADRGVSGHGPYWALPPREYFEQQTGRLHTERGMPAPMNIESLRRTLRPENLWPQSHIWGKHDFTLAGAQRGASFNRIVTEGYGRPLSAEEFCQKAQFVSYDGYRAMFEAEGQQRQGLLIWMSHPAWPSMTWQCYDYYLEPTASFFGAKKACEPIHIQLNAATGRVEVVNRSAGTKEKLTAEVSVLDVNGRQLKRSSERLSSPDDSTTPLSEAWTPETDGAYFLRLALKEGKQTLSENTYILSTRPGDFRALNSLPKTQPSVVVSRKGETMTVTLENRSQTPAVMLRLNLLDAEGNQILPVSYSDNYFHLLPAESRTISISWREEDQQTEGVTLQLSGYNVEPFITD